MLLLEVQDEGIGLIHEAEDSEVVVGTVNGLYERGLGVAQEHWCDSMRERDFDNNDSFAKLKCYLFFDKQCSKNVFWLMC